MMKINPYFSQYIPSWCNDFWPHHPFSVRKNEYYIYYFFESHKHIIRTQLKPWNHDIKRQSLHITLTQHPTSLMRKNPTWTEPPPKNVKVMNRKGFQHVNIVSSLFRDPETTARAWPQHDPGWKSNWPGQESPGPLRYTLTPTEIFYFPCDWGKT